MAVEIIIFFYSLVVVLILYKILRTVKHLFINTIAGILILASTNFLFDLNIAYTWLSILTCTLAGVFGAALIILLHVIGIYF